MSGVYKRVRSLLQYIVIFSNYEAFELLGGVILVVSGMVILNPYADIYSNGIVYQVISKYISEEGLGAIILFTGINSIFALLDGSFVYRKYVCIVQAIIWGALFTTFLSVNPTAWFPWFTGVFCLFSVATAARIHRDIREHKPTWTNQ